MFTVVLREQWPKLSVLGSSNSRDVFKSIDAYQGLGNILDNITIINFESPLHFANSNRFSQRMENIILEKAEKKSIKPIIILDCSAISYIDMMGLEALRTAHKDAKNEGIDLIFADFSESVLEMLRKTKFLDDISRNSVFPNLNMASKFAIDISNGSLKL
uniref:STAS domain-containing protein n=1 Tax=Acrobeloides nanus TaxID=290746 RepID=A0A914DLG6_9BILA